MIFGNITTIHSKGFHTGASLWYPLIKTKNVTSTHNLIKTAGYSGCREKREEGRKREVNMKWVTHVDFPWSIGIHRKKSYNLE